MANNNYTHTHTHNLYTCCSLILADKHTHTQRCSAFIAATYRVLYLFTRSVRSHTFTSHCRESNMLSPANAVPTPKKQTLSRRFFRKLRDDVQCLLGNMCMPAVRLAFNKISERQKVGQGSVCETAHDQATYSAHHVTCVYYRFFFLWLEFPWFQMEKIRFIV